MLNCPSKIHMNIWYKIALGTLLFTIFYFYHSYAVDLEQSFLPATKLLLSGKSPYNAPFYNPPWALLPVIPFTLLPLKVARAAFATVTLLIYFYIARKLGASIVAAVAFVISPPVIISVIYGSLDWLVLLGLILPPSLGVLLLITKPQVGVGAVLYRLVKAKHWHKRWDILLPTIILTLLSLLIYGLWPLNTMHAETDSTTVGFNTTAWWTVPIGVYLLARGIRDEDISLAIAASPFFSPHVTIYSWCVLFLPLLKDTKLTIIASSLFWFLTLLKLVV